MANLSQDKDRSWLTIGLLLLLVSGILYTVDYFRSDEDISMYVQHKLQRDFEQTVQYYNLSEKDRYGWEKFYHACELWYDKSGHLTDWSENQFLPPQDTILKLRRVPTEKVVKFQNQAHYQIRKKYGDSTYIALIPIHQSYEINNQFLIPYIFLGRWQDDARFSDQDLRNLKVNIDKGERGIQIYDPYGLPVFSLEYLPLTEFRSEIRYSVLLLLIGGVFCISIFLRLYTLEKWKYRYVINGALLVSVLGIRFLMWLLDLPASYVNLELFRPGVLSFHEIFAPSLGDLTINILTAVISIWIIYTHFFRMINVPYRKISRIRILKWVVGISTLVISSLLLKWYVDVFSLITQNSQVDIEFSNIFKANVNSFLILLNVGILLLGIYLIVITLLKYNVIMAQNEIQRPQFLLIHAPAIFFINLYLFYGSGNLVPVAVVCSLTLFLLLLSIHRYPDATILNQDIVNYLLIIFTFSMLVTFNVVQGINQTNEFKVEQIAKQILGNQETSTLLAFDKSRIELQADSALARRQFRLLRNEKFANWIKEEYLDPNFKGFEVWMYLYDQNGKRIDNNSERPPSFGLEADISLEDRAESVVGAENFYRLPNFENRYVDLYVGEIDLSLGRYGSVHIVLELSPNRRETEGLYPSLSMDEKVYSDTKLINSFDHAVYRDGLLYYYRGETNFPIYFPDQENIETQYSLSLPGYNEHTEPLDERKLVVVRYKKPGVFNIITLFSFIFYFYCFSTVLLIIVPVYLFRTAHKYKFSYKAPLRTKIRYGLLIISILPMIIIIGFLFPFIGERYEKQARLELREEASRITNLVGEDYVFMNNDVLSKYTRLKGFRNRIKELEPIIRNDINVFDEDGKRIASTQPLIFETGLSGDLMNASAFKELKKGQKSEMVVNEKIGDLSYLSIYRPIIGLDAQPIGYLNVSYIAKQDQLEEQILDFLAYIANIYLLVFLMINLIAVVLSNTITQPLSLVQQRLESTKIGMDNKPIDYESNDEIGEIVEAYNKMVTQLSDSEKKLAQTEREMAWRQMARQVAHEIKNPLTPMRLSIQHLSRAWKERANSLDKMFPRVMKTLLVQIDTMVRIANSFSEFARMPDAIKKKVLLNEVLLEVVDLYSQSEEAMWLIDIAPEKFSVYADRDQLSRCFNNIIKNGIQAIDGEGIMHISMKIEEGMAYIEIKDNGKGMSEEVQERLFEPSFSTKSSGMGLGLAIVKRIIETSGGKIHFKSRVDEGTSFYLEFPEASLDPMFEENGQVYLP
ncbi:MAG: ATP-binding protein [Bacteroidota bacterium]